MNDRDHQAFSFAKSAEAHGRTLVTDLLEAKLRLPLSDNEHPFSNVEQAAQKSLGLSQNSPFLVIERARLLDGQPSAIHRVFLDPSRFPSDFLERHDLKTESLIDIYDHYKFKLVSRDTVLLARGVNIYEINVIHQRYHSDPRNRVVLDAEQQLYAQDPQTGKLFVLEFLKASYLENWKYEIKNRPA